MFRTHIITGPVGRNLSLVALILSSLGVAEAQNTCAAIALDPSAPLTSNLGTTCKVSDLLPAVTLFQMSSLFYPLFAQSYSVKVPDAGAVLRVNVSTPSFPPVILILDDKGNFLGSTGGSSATGAEMLAGLPGGITVTVIAATAGATGGSFTLTPTFQDFRTCSQNDYSLGSTVNGTLSDSSCRFLDLKQPSTNARPIDVYKFSLPSLTLADILLDSTVFNSFLYLLDAKTLKVLQSDDDSQQSLDAEFFMSIPQGDYLLLATTVTAGGNYSLISRSAQPRTCAEGSISLPGSVQASLTNNDCELLEYVPFAGDQSSIRAYTMDVPRKALVQVDLTSSQFDAYLVLLDDQKRDIQEDNNSGGGSNARLTLTLNPGRYTVLANSYDVGETGNFTLTTNLQDPRTCPINFANSGDTVNGTITTSDCRVRDVLTGISAPQFVRQYRIDVPDGGGGVLVMDASSSQFTPAILLATTDGVLITSNGLSGTGAYELQYPVTPGSYNIVVYSGSSSASVNFTLKPVIIQ